MRSRSIAAAVAMLAAAASAGSPAGASPSGPVARASSSRGAFWYTISGWAPPGSVVVAEIEWTTAGRASGTVGAMYVRMGPSPDTGAALYAATTPGGRYASAVVSAPGSHVRPLRTGAQKRSDLDGWFMLQAELIVPDDGGTFDFASFVAADGPVSRQRIKVTFPRGGLVRAESRGSGSLTRREWDFAGPVVAEAREGNSIASATGIATVRAAAAGATAATFRRSPIIVFVSFNQIGVGGAGSWQGGIPAVFTVEAPDRTTTVPDQIIRAGPAGPYRFRIDAFASGLVLADTHVAGAVQTGKVPAVILAAADADFPACTTTRVRTRARDGHPVCGP